MEMCRRCRGSHIELLTAPESLCHRLITEATHRTEVQCSQDDASPKLRPGVHPNECSDSCHHDQCWKHIVRSARHFECRTCPGSTFKRRQIGVDDAEVHHLGVANGSSSKSERSKWR